jgi:hypothetical protein
MGHNKRGGHGNIQHGNGTLGWILFFSPFFSFSVGTCLFSIFVLFLLFSFLFLSVILSVLLIFFQLQFAFTSMIFNFDTLLVVSQAAELIDPSNRIESMGAAKRNWHFD